MRENELKNYWSLPAEEQDKWTGRRFKRRSPTNPSAIVVVKRFIGDLGNVRRTAPRHKSA